jgi:hypothetical protein
VGFGVPSFRESKVAVLRIVFEAVLFERDRRTRMVAVVFAVAGRVRVLVPVVAVAVPTLERLSEFFKHSLTGLGIEVRVAFVRFEIRLKRRVVGNLAASVSDAARCPAGDVPELASGEPKRIETVLYLRLIPDRRFVSTSNGSIRHT